MAQNERNRYEHILETIFKAHYKPKMKFFEFARDEIVSVAAGLGIKLPKNLGDLIYSFRFRADLPEAIVRTAPAGMEWIIRLAGRAKYRMALVRMVRIVPNPALTRIKIPDATPEIVLRHAKGDEQALLAKVRYNRLIDLFLGVVAYSLQSHLRTTVPDVGQIETDELYVGVRNSGQQYIIPVQAKGGTDRIGAVQAEQDLALCRDVFPELTPRPVAVQFVRDDDGEVIVMFELKQQGDDILIERESHYRLVSADAISSDDLRSMADS